MNKFTSIQQATDYIYTQLKEINPDIQKDDVYDTIMDEVLESAEYILSDEDVRFLEENEKNNKAIDDYLQWIIPDYSDLLSDIVVDMVSDEIVEAE